MFVVGGCGGVGGVIVITIPHIIVLIAIDDDIVVAASVRPKE